MGVETKTLADGIPDEDGDESGSHAGLREDGAEGRPGDAHAEAVDEEDIEDDVRGEADDTRDQWGLGVLESTEHARGGEDDEHAGEAGGRDPQVDDRLVERFGGGAEECAEGS